MRKGFVGASAGTGESSAKAGFTGNPVSMSFSAGMPHSRILPMVMRSVTRKLSEGARSQEALISMESVTTVKTGSRLPVSRKFLSRK